jgi:hypothetical protein
MSGHVFKWVIVAFVLAGISYPVSIEMKARAAVQRDMINSLDINDAAALKQWQGSVTSFIAVLHERCMSTHDRDAEACARYTPPGG